MSTPLLLRILFILRFQLKLVYRPWSVEFISTGWLLISIGEAVCDSAWRFLLAIGLSIKYAKMTKPSRSCCTPIVSIRRIKRQIFRLNDNKRISNSCDDVERLFEYQRNHRRYATQPVDEHECHGYANHFFVFIYLVVLRKETGG